MNNIIHVTGSLFAVVVSGVTAYWAIQALQTPSTKKRLLLAKKNEKTANFLDIPGPVGYPFVGVLFDLLPYINSKRMDLYTTLLNDQYGGICRLNAGFHIVCIDDPAMAKRILSSQDFVRGNVLLEAAFDVAPYALFVLPSGDQWKKHRKGLQPAFGPNHLREAFAVSLECGDELLDIWESQLRKGDDTRNVMDDFTMLTGDVIAKIAFSINLGAVKSLELKEVLEFHEHMEKIAETIQNRVGLRSMKILWGLFGIKSSNLQTTRTYMTTMLQKVIDDKKEIIAQKKNEGIDVSQDKWGRDLLDRLLTSDMFNDEEIRSEVFGFFLAGHETTANTMTFAVYEMITNPRVYEKLQEEVDAVLQGQAPTNENISSLRYLDAFFKETQRFHTVVTTIARDSVNSTTLTSQDGLTITFPPKVQFLLNVPRIHTSTTFWGEDANEFKPDRWLNNFVPVPGSYFPFGDGPMSCIGQKMAIIETKVTLIKILQRFTIKKSPRQGEIKPVTTLTHGLKDGLL
ncbi:hypothetical protein HK098_006080, partial [Nowakowskiella sp. JEL0407]